MFIRLATAVSLGTAVTFGLLFLMQLMIATGRHAVTDTQAFRVTDFVRVERIEVVDTKQRKPEKLPEPEQRPEMPSPESTGDVDLAFAVSLATPTMDPSAGARQLGFGVSDGEYLPIVKVAPVYPARALARRLEGHVVVEFAVTPTGTVKDVVVIESTTPLFEAPAVEAALKFKYKPRVVDGTPVEVRGVRNKILFAMEGSALAASM